MSVTRIICYGGCGFPMAWCQCLPRVPEPDAATLARIDASIAAWGDDIDRLYPLADTPPDPATVSFAEESAAGWETEIHELFTRKPEIGA